MTYEQIIGDVFKAAAINYSNMETEKIKTEGFMLPYLVNVPQNYVYKVSDDLKNALLNLRKKGKKVCLVTNA